MNDSQASQPGRLEVSEEDHIEIWTISAPERGNSLTNHMLNQIEQHATRVKNAFTETPTTAPRCILLCGGGERHFCTGYFLHDLLDQIKPVNGRKLNSNDHPLERAVRSLAEIPCPTIAVIQGAVYGAGLELALNCDLRIAARRAKFCLPPTKLGIVYSFTGLQKLVSVVGDAAARELIYTGDPISCEYAQSIRLVNHMEESTAELWEKARGLAQKIAGNSPIANAGTKQLLNIISRNTSYQDRQQACDPELQRKIGEVRRSAFESKDFARAVKNKLAGQPTTFTGE